MANENKFLNLDGLRYLWLGIKNYIQNSLNGKVDKVEGFGLSKHNFDDEAQTKLSGIEENANKTIIVDSLSSTASDKALSANQGKELNDKINSINTSMADLGAGDMLRATYDQNLNGVVDNSEKLDGHAASYFAKATDLATKANDADLADVAKSGSYNDLKDKPTDFAPSEHTHEIAEVNGLDTALNGKAAEVHTHEQSEITGLEETIEEVTEIANGKCACYVFDVIDSPVGDETALDTWLANSANTAGLKVGDVFLIRKTDVPDYWWDGSTKQILETTKVDLTAISVDDINSLVGFPASAS